MNASRNQLTKELLENLGANARSRTSILLALASARGLAPCSPERLALEEQASGLLDDLNQAGLVERIEAKRYSLTQLGRRLRTRPDTNGIYMVNVLLRARNDSEHFSKTVRAYQTFLAAYLAAAVAIIAAGISSIPSSSEASIDGRLYSSFLIAAFSALTIGTGGSLILLDLRALVRLRPPNKEELATFDAVKAAARLLIVLIVIAGFFLVASSWAAPGEG